MQWHRLCTCPGFAGSLQPRATRQCSQCTESCWGPSSVLIPAATLTGHCLAELRSAQVGRALDEQSELASSHPEAASEPSNPAQAQHTPATEPSSTDRASGPQPSKVRLAAGFDGQRCGQVISSGAGCQSSLHTLFTSPQTCFCFRLCLLLLLWFSAYDSFGPLASCSGTVVCLALCSASVTAVCSAEIPLWPQICRLWAPAGLEGQGSFRAAGGRPGDGLRQRSLAPAGGLPGAPVRGPAAGPGQIRAAITVTSAREGFGARQKTS